MTLVFPSAAVAARAQRIRKPGRQASPAARGQVSDTRGPENIHDDLHPYSNDDSGRDSYAACTVRADDVTETTSSSVYVNTAFPSEQEENVYDGLRSKYDDDLDREPYAVFTVRADGVTKPTSSSGYANVVFPSEM